MIFLRCPRLFFEPRFWAEEGTSFFSYAFSHSALAALIRPDGGNYDFPRNLASILAVHLAPLEWAPLVTTLFSFAVQLIPLVLILNHSSTLNSTMRQAVAIAFYLVAAASDELWLTTLHSQRYLSVAAFLVLLDKPSPDRPLKTWLLRFLVLVTGLSGPETVLLAPLFLLKWFLERERENAVHAALVCACAALQFSIFILAPSEISRFDPLDLQTFATIFWTKNFMLPLLGWTGIKPFRWAYLHVAGVWGQILGVGLLLGAIAVFYALARRTASRDRILILGSFVLTTLFSVVFAIGDKTKFVDEFAGNRYFYAPNFMLALLLLLNVDGKALQRRLSSWLWTGLLTLALVTGTVRFWRFGGYFTHWDVAWKQEVAIWREDPQHELRIWPQGWTVRLNGKATDSTP